MENFDNKGVAKFLMVIKRKHAANLETITEEVINFMTNSSEASFILLYLGKRL